MSQQKRASDLEKQKQIIAAARQEQERREKTYRERALKIYPWICAWCGREFKGKRLRELSQDKYRDFNGSHFTEKLNGPNFMLTYTLNKR